MSVDYRAVLADARDKRDALTRLTEALEPLVNTDSPPKAFTRPLSPVPMITDGAGLEAKVLDAIEAGATSPKAITAKTGIPKATLQRTLAVLMASHQVTKTGQTQSTRYRVTRITKSFGAA